jgi:hypothetical protein
MPWCGCGILFKLEMSILFYNFGGIGGILDKDMVAI